MKLQYILLFATLIPLLTNIYIAKYLHDIRESDKCKNIDSELVSFYYDFYILSLVILVVSVIGIILAFAKYTNILTHKNTMKLSDLFLSNDKLIEVVSIVFTAGLVKIVYDLKSDTGCKDIDPSMASNIYYYGMFGLVISALNLVNIDFYKYLI
tara:strand:+ start:271 stop:732 length:462 start_codon:yes stop_codon:yes gene_type:complete